MRFWLKWSFRDLRARWLQVLAIAMIIALGTGIFSGLGGQKDWRINSLDKSYDALNMYDLRLQLTEGSYVDQEAITTALTSVDGVQAVEPRLLVPTLVDASHDGDSILVQGRMLGTRINAQVNQINVIEGRNFTADDSGQQTAIVDYLFARYYDLEPGDSIQVSGNIALDFVGTGQSPEYFQISPDKASFFLSESSFAVLYVPLDTLQAMSDHEGLLNDVVILVTSEADRDQVQEAIEQQMARTFPETGFTITPKEDDIVYALMYDDARGDQEMWDIIATLFLIGAAMAAFNLSGRIVEAQRREIGIGMALGLPRHKIAFRPLLMGLQIAIMGTILGLIIGYIMSLAFASFVEEYMPLPTWVDPFSMEAFVRAALLGILVPFAATLYPVWRAVRVPPIDAIKTGYLVAKGGGLAPLLKRVPLPGHSFTQMPFRNLLRSPWRTLLTLLGISIAIILLVSMVGMLDTFLFTIDSAEDAYLQKNRDRMTIMLDTFYPEQSAEAITTLTDDKGNPLFSASHMGVTASGFFPDGDEDIFTAIDMMDMDNPIWTPTLIAGKLPEDGEPSIVISEKAAKDLDVWVGDSLTVRHPIREGLFSFQMVETPFTVIGIHNSPLRMTSYMNLHQAEKVGIAGLTNTITVRPAPGIDEDTIRRKLFTQPGVASVMVANEFIEQFDQVLDMFITFMRVVQGVVLVLAFLIAFNSTSISVDERRREIATMFAFGLRIRTVTRMQMVENLVMGILGTIIGVGLGYVLLYWLFMDRVNEMLPEIQFTIDLSMSTFIIAVILGIVVVALTPVLSIRKMIGLDIPSTLRVME